MHHIFNTLDVFLSPSVSYHYSNSGTANAVGFRQSSFGVTFDTSRFICFEEETDGSSGSGTNRQIFTRRAEGPNINIAVNRSGTTYTGDLKLRARQISIDVGVTALGIFNTWLAPQYNEYTQRLWGCYSSSGETGAIEFYLDFSINGGTTYKSALMRCNLL